MVQVNRVCLKILFINRPQFLVDSNEIISLMKTENTMNLTSFQALSYFIR